MFENFKESVHVMVPASRPQAGGGGLHAQIVSDRIDLKSLRFHVVISTVFATD